MNRYETLQQKALGLAFILAPSLMIIGAAALVLGIGLTPFGTDSWVDGIFQALAFALMIPVSFELARLLGQRAPVLAIVCAAAALGWGMSIVAAAAKGLQMDIIQAGLNESIWNVMGSTPATVPVLIGSMIGILSALGLGVGLLWKGGVSRTSAILFTLATVLFFVGIGGGAEIARWQTHVAYPLAALLWLIALAPIGLRYLKGESNSFELEMTAT
jgi:hypothetical protein